MNLKHFVLAILATTLLTSTSINANAQNPNPPEKITANNVIEPYLLTPGGQNETGTPSSTAIYRGRPAFAAEAPEAGGFEPWNKFGYYCRVTALGTKTVLIPTHCLFNVNRQPLDLTLYKVTFGSLSRSVIEPTEQIFGVKDPICYPGYNANFADGLDLCILSLTGTLRIGNGVMPAVLTSTAFLSSSEQLTQIVPFTDTKNQAYGDGINETGGLSDIVNVTDLIPYSYISSTERGPQTTYCVIDSPPGGGDSGGVIKDKNGTTTGIISAYGQPTAGCNSVVLSPNLQFFWSWINETVSAKGDLLFKGFANKLFLPLALVN